MAPFAGTYKRTKEEKYEEFLNKLVRAVLIMVVC